MSDNEPWHEVFDKERKRHAHAAVGEKVVPLHPSESDASLPDASDPYKAASMAATHGTIPHLAVIMGAAEFRPGGKAYRYFQYVHLDSDTDLGYSKDGQVMTLRFISYRPVEVIVTGRNLLRLCHQIHNHRIAWIRLADRDFTSADEAAGNEVIITKIQIQPLVNEFG